MSTFNTAYGRSLGKWSTPDDVLHSMRKESPEQMDRLANSTVIVTGANTGIGKETAIGLRKAGCHVVYACRSLEKAADAVTLGDAYLKSYFEETGAIAVSQRKPSIIQLDLSDLENVRRFVEEFLRRSEREGWPPLTCLVLNAGVIGLGGFALSKQNYELTFAVNHLGHWLLTQLLLPTLRTFSPSRVIVVASDSHYGPLVTEDVTGQSDFLANIVHPRAEERSGVKMAAKMYGQSKLCNVIFAQELHRKESAAGSGVAALSLHPGSLILTDIARQSWLASFLHRYVVSWWTKTAPQGASTTVFGCTMPHDQVMGQYLDNCSAKRPHRLCRGDDGADAGRALELVSSDLCQSFL